jgi:hypothetical protein
MQRNTVFAEACRWFGAEGIEDGKPCLFRGKSIPDRFIGDSSLPYLLVITHPFEVADSTGLPTVAQYETIEDFERQYVDLIEARKVGILVFVKTANGAVRYFMYVSNVATVANMLYASPIQLELASREDRDWHEYRAFIAGLRVEE